MRTRLFRSMGSPHFWGTSMARNGMLQYKARQHKARRKKLKRTTKLKRYQFLPSAREDARWDKEKSMKPFAALLRKDNQPVRYLVVDVSVFARKNLIKMIEQFGGEVAGDAG